MPYQYQTECPRLFEPDGNSCLAAIRAQALRTIDRYGSVMITSCWDGCPGDTHFILACLDWMVEQGELIDLSVPGVGMAARIFVMAPAAPTPDLFSMLSIIEEFRDKSST